MNLSDQPGVGEAFSAALASAQEQRAMTVIESSYAMFGTVGAPRSTQYVIGDVWNPTPDEREFMEQVGLAGHLR